MSLISMLIHTAIWFVIGCVLFVAFPLLAIFPLVFWLLDMSAITRRARHKQMMRELRRLRQ